MDVNTRALTLILCAAITPALAACGKTERSGSVGDELSAKGLKVTVQRVDTSPPVPAQDVTGLSLPAPGYSLVGLRVRVCSDHGGAIGQYDFGLRASQGTARLKFPAMNYDEPFDTVRSGCGTGWIVFEVPRGARPEQATFGFDDTGSRRHEQNRVSARFSWKVG